MAQTYAGKNDGTRHQQGRVIGVLNHGEIINIYDNDRPFPSVLLLGLSESRPLHVVVSFDETQGIFFVITAYEPDLNIFEADFKTKKK